MKKITLSLPDHVEEELRRIVEERYSGIKGALSIITTNALIAHFKKLRDEA